jgi:hypothetical protein
MSHDGHSAEAFWRVYLFSGRDRSGSVPIGMDSPCAASKTAPSGHDHYTVMGRLLSASHVQQAEQSVPPLSNSLDAHARTAGPESVVIDTAAKFRVKP